MRPPVELGVHRAPRCEPVVSLVRSRRAPPVPLIVLPKSCSCRLGPCPPPPSLVWACLSSFFLSLGVRSYLCKTSLPCEPYIAESGSKSYSKSALFVRTQSRHHGVTWRGSGRGGDSRSSECSTCRCNDLDPSGREDEGWLAATPRSANLEQSRKSSEQEGKLDELRAAR